MSDYLAILDSRPHQGDACLVDLSERLKASGPLRKAVSHGRLHVWTQTSSGLPVHPLPDGGVLIGNVYAKRSGEQLTALPSVVSSGAPERERAAALSRYAWGAYVALWPDAEGGLWIWRDPSGALDALVWRVGDLTFCASSLQVGGLTELLPKVSIDWSRVAAFLCNPSEIGWDGGLEGVSAAPPGVLRHDAAVATRDEPVWTPARAALDPWQEDRSVASLAWELEATLDRCVSAELRGRRVLCEISGGLDSACIASCASRSHADIAQWLNYVVADAEADEREFARAIAARLKVPLTEVRKPVVRLSQIDLQTLCLSARPPLNAMDAGYDDEMAARLTACSAQAVLTGQGGDIVFNGLPIEATMDDAIWRCGRGAVLSPFARRVVRTRQMSLWSFLQRKSPKAALQASGLAPLSWVTPEIVAEYRTRHGWLEDLENYPAGKRLQIEAFTRSLLFHGDCSRRRRGRLIHGPLLQPVVELCLKIPTDMLAASGVSRGLARRAFESRLPPAIISREAKGDLTAAYGRELADDLPFLRDFLLGGRLASAGLVDLDVMEAGLSWEAFIWNGAFADVSDLVAIEGWIRAWEARGSSWVAQKTSARSS